ncbi:MAG: hypothetical protein KR126chlam6_00471 [Candidatus Anoxychlamydiales bacterium]|nr:hypothetical protein [Candidatus Anoxychlamydiales bacterium]
MNYTREPIIETIITPKEGSKLVVRKSKGAMDEYFVEALEIVSFGNASFFRSTERPKSFLVPVSDYEVIEIKETKMILKSASFEKSIKIGGGKTEDTKSPKRKKMHKKSKPQIETQPIQPKTEKGGGQDDETQVSSSILRKLFPPPPNLIKENLNHIKSPEKIDESISKEIVKEPVKDIPKEEKKEEILLSEEPKDEKIKEEKPSDEEKKE